MSSQTNLSSPTIAQRWIFPILGILLAGGFAYFSWQVSRQQDAISLAFTNTPTPTPTLTAVPVAEDEEAENTPAPSSTPIATATKTPRPTRTPTPQPTATATPYMPPTRQPAQEHIIQPNELILNLALRYDVTMDSIEAINPGLDIDSIVEGQRIFVPMPTATPPLVAVEVDLYDRTVIADPTDCLIHVIEQNNTYFSIAIQYDVPPQAILDMNRLDSQSILSIGDEICVPVIIELEDAGTEGVFLSERIEQTIRSVVQVIQPQQNAIVAVPNERVALQWVTDRPLESDEWFLVEYIELLEGGDPRPSRILTRQNRYVIPAQVGKTYQWSIRYVAQLDGTSKEASYQPLGDVVEITFQTE